MRPFRTWNRFVTLGGILLAACLCAAGAFLVSRIPFSVPQLSGPQVTIIPVSTYTPTPDQPEGVETASAEPPVAGNGIRINSSVQISGTAGEGLRIRSNPGLDSEINFYGMDNEVFQVMDGPVDADGYTWWYISSPYDDARSGWAASSYLTIIEQ